MKLFLSFFSIKETEKKIRGHMGETRSFFFSSLKMNFIKANYLFESPICLIKQASVKRTWMDNTQEKFAYRCLPLSIANQTSWDVLCPSSIKATWEGNVSASGVKVEYLDNHSFRFAGSEFGHGVLTFHVDFVISSSENTCLYVKGPANSYKKNINALEAIVETHWLPFTFTFNWLFNEPGEVIFEKGEPMFTFFPFCFDYIESFKTEVDFIKNDKKFASDYQAYSDSRKNHIQEGHTNGESWQKYYMKGISPNNQKANSNHKTKIILSDFDYEVSGKAHGL